MKFELKTLRDYFFPQTRVHLDYASATPVRKEIVRAMNPYWNLLWANPSALYKEGVAAREVVNGARAKLAHALHVRPSDITFTSGGTESNNLALVGYIDALHAQGRRYETMEIISTRIEHPSILETLEYLTQRGVRIVYVPITANGRIDIQQFERALTPQTVLVTVAYANSETGVVQDIKKITRIVRRHAETTQTSSYVHVDASQAPLWLSCALDMLGVDMMTLDAGKCYGPKGVGVLVHRHWVSLSPIQRGGGQENSLRSGTESPALIVGCVEAIVRGQDAFSSRSEAVASLRDIFLSYLAKEITGITVNGDMEHRLPNNINISIPGLDTEFATIWLDSRGIACSTKSACGVGTGGGSYVIREMTHDETRAIATMRFTLGEETTLAHVKKAVTVLREHVEKMRNADVIKV